MYNDELNCYQHISNHDNGIHRRIEQNFVLQDVRIICSRYIKAFHFHINQNLNLSINIEFAN